MKPNSINFGDASIKRSFVANSSAVRRCRSALGIALCIGPLIAIMAPQPAPAQWWTGGGGSPSDAWRWLAGDSAPTTQAQPHPAVARIVVPERNGTSLGSGTLIDANGRFGLVLTNWHVIRDAAGAPTVIFPNGQSSAAQIVKWDSEWDLAALVVWKPDVEPVRLAATAPRRGDALTIAGYGKGEYRAARGECTQFLSPAVNLPAEMVELSAQARQGDSGGPIFNDRGELAGVLFGAGWGSTAGSHVTRVRQFLDGVVPSLPNEAHPPMPPTTLAAISEQGRDWRRSTVDAASESRNEIARLAALPAQHAAALDRPAESVAPDQGRHVDTPRGYDRWPSEEEAARFVPATHRADASSSVSSDGSANDAIPAAPSVATQPLESANSAEQSPAPQANVAVIGWRDLCGATPWEQGKSALAVLGLISLLMYGLGRVDRSHATSK